MKLPVPLLFTPFIFLPLLEIALFIYIGEEIGLMGVIFLCLLSAFAGVMVLRHYGLSVILQLQDALRDGFAPVPNLIDAVCVVSAAMLLIFPGVASDALALFLLWPRARLFIRARAMPSANDNVIEGDYKRVDRDGEAL